MRRFLLALALTLSACASSTLLDRFAETHPEPPVSDMDALLAVALENALGDPDADLLQATSSSRVAVDARYYVEDASGWSRRPVTAAALPAGTDHTFVLLDEDQIYSLARERDGFARVIMTLADVRADTAHVRVGMHRLSPSPGAQRSGVRPGFVGSGGSRTGRFVREGSAWVFDTWTGWIGS